MFLGARKRNPIVVAFDNVQNKGKEEGGAYLRETRRRGK